MTDGLETLLLNNKDKTTEKEVFFFDTGALYNKMSIFTGCECIDTTCYKSVNLKREFRNYSLNYGLQMNEVLQNLYQYGIHVQLNNIDAIKEDNKPFSGTIV